MSGSRPRVGGRGQALAEFALVFPILILLVVALADVGRLVFIYNSLTNGVREGARLAIVNQDATAVRDRVIGQTFAATPTVTVAFKRVSPNADPGQNADCAPISVGCVAVVRGSVTLAPITPLIGAVVGPIAMTAESQAPVEFVCPNNPAWTGSCPRQP